MSTNYSFTLDSLLEALAKHPDFAEIGDMVKKKMRVSAAMMVEEIIAKQEAQRKPVDAPHHSETKQLETKDDYDGLPILIPTMLETTADKAETKAADDDMFIIIPDSL